MTKEIFEKLRLWFETELVLSMEEYESGNAPIRRVQEAINSLALLKELSK